MFFLMSCFNNNYRKYCSFEVVFELLMRWQSAEGIISPNQFIPLAEELGLIIKMTESAMDRD